MQDNSQNLRIITCTTNAYRSYTHNLLLSMQRLGIHKNLHIYCFDEESENFFRNALLHSNTHFYQNSLNIQKETKMLYGNKDFEFFMFQRIGLIHELLLQGINILQVDGDVVFYQDPRNYLNEHVEDYDVLIQQESIQQNQNGCMGFVYIVANQQTVKQFDFQNFIALRNKHPEMSYCCDQYIFNNELKQNLKVKFLPVHQFQVGQYIYTQPVIQPEAYIVHFNFVIGDQKMEKMKRYGAWLLDDES